MRHCLICSCYVNNVLSKIGGEGIDKIDVLQQFVPENKSIFVNKAKDSTLIAVYQHILPHKSMGGGSYLYFGSSTIFINL